MQYLVNKNRLGQQDGSIMVTALMIMAILSIIGIYANSIATTELQVTTNLQTKKTSFYNSEAGIQYALEKINHEIWYGSSVFSDVKNDIFANIKDDIDANKYDSSMDSSINNNFTFAIDIIEDVNNNDFWPDSTNQYGFRSTGTANNAYVSNMESEIFVKFRLRETQLPPFAAFGDRYSGVDNSGILESYDVDDPTIEGRANIGSNTQVEIKQNALIDGDVILGIDANGDPAVASIHTGADIYGDQIALTDPIKSDPLRMFNPDGTGSGGTYDPKRYENNNDNNRIDSSFLSNDNKLDLKNNDVLELTAGTYYFTDMNLRNGSELIIHPNVNIFIDGGMVNTGNSSLINAVEGASSLNFSIFSNYDSGGSSNAALQFNNNSEFRGLIYAPKANVEMKNSADVYGSIWGKRVFIHNTGVLYYDVALENKHFGYDGITLVSWEERR